MPVVSLTSILHILVLVSSLAAFLAIRDYQRRRGLPYPPGPRPLPLIGNIFDIPKRFSWLSYLQFSKKHGDVLSFHVFGQVIVVLNSYKANKDLLERRGEIYSDRPVIPIFEMMKWDWNVAFSKYTESWRLSRKLLDRGLRPAAIAAYRPLLQQKAHLLLAQMLANPDGFEAHLNHMTGSLILAMAYGYEVNEPNDPKVEASKTFLQITGETSLPGCLLVNDLPYLRYVVRFIPEWLPRLSYKPLVRYGYGIGLQVLHGPMEFVRASMLDGTAQPSIALENLQETEQLDELEREKAVQVIARALGSLRFQTASSIMVFIIATLVRPEIQIMAQKELDAVTGRERLPTFEDRPRLPFIDAICKEVLRWRPVTPLGFPHATTEDDVYQGYFIPKGAVVISNIWAILHDPVMYPEPDVFKPERFINPDGSLRDDSVLTSPFGFGKRVCPGRHLADATLFIAIASLLSVFNIKSNLTDDGPICTRPQARAFGAIIAFCR
ncbi:cytochrome P450 [Russula vinacea]|nr:cytochrome P450 [Russula vinacea]